MMHHSLLLSTHPFATRKPHVPHSSGLTYTKPHIRLDVSIRSVGCGVRDWTRCLCPPVQWWQQSPSISIDDDEDDGDGEAEVSDDVPAEVPWSLPLPLSVLLSTVISSIELAEVSAASSESEESAESVVSPEPCAFFVVDWLVEPPAFLSTMTALSAEPQPAATVSAITHTTDASARVAHLSPTARGFCDIVRCRIPDTVPIFFSIPYSIPSILMTTRAPAHAIDTTHVRTQAS